MQRRKHARYTIWFPVQVDTAELEEALAVNHNIGAGGMLIALSAELKADQKVKVTFRIPPHDSQERIVEGMIIRVEKNLDDPDGMWPFRIAVAFDEIAQDLVPLLEKAAIHMNDR